jgi:hypothetical protein
MFDEFKDNIKKKYDDEDRWQKIYKRFRFHGGQIERFLINDNNLIYYENSSDFRQYLCSPKNLEKKIFRIIYNKRNHINFHRAYDRIRISLYLYKLIKRFRTYIEYYSKTGDVDCFGINYYIF